MIIQTEQEVSDRVKYWWAKGYNVMGKPIPEFAPTIIFNPNLRTTAGKAHLQKNKVEFSIPLMRGNPESFDEIIGHEVAHLIAWNLYKDKGHGIYWKLVMIGMGLRPDRCHKFETVKNNVGKLAVACGCPNGCLVSRCIRHRISQGKLYRCRKCNQRLSVGAKSPLQQMAEILQ